MVRELAGTFHVSAGEGFFARVGPGLASTPILTQAVAIHSFGKAVFAYALRLG